MYHSISLKSLHQSSPTILSNNDEEQIRDLISSLVDKIDKEMNNSNDLSVKLFNASSISHHRISSDNNEDLFQTLDDCKHSIGILVDDQDVPSRKDLFDFIIRIFINILK
jgi:flagellin-like hook-associated protein FlgL